MSELRGRFRTAVKTAFLTFFYNILVFLTLGLVAIVRIYGLELFTRLLNP